MMFSEVSSHSTHVQFSGLLRSAGASMYSPAWQRHWAALVAPSVEVIACCCGQRVQGSLDARSLYVPNEQFVQTSVSVEAVASMSISVPGGHTHSNSVVVGAMLGAMVGAMLVGDALGETLGATTGDALGDALGTEVARKREG